MERLYRRIDTKVTSPSDSGWHYTDKGTLYYFYEEKTWSCRDDRVSEEYPHVWYKEVPDFRLPTEEEIKKQSEILYKAASPFKHWSVVLQNEKRSSFIKGSNFVIEKLKKHFGW